MTEEHPPSTPDASRRGLRVLALVTDAFGAYGGISQYNSDFLNALARTDGVARVDVLSRLAPDPDFPTELGIAQHPAVHDARLYALRSLWTCLKTRPDVIYSGHIYHGPLAVRLASAFRATLVSQLHGTEIWSRLAPRHVAPLVRSRMVLCVSRDTVRCYAAQEGATGSNATVVPNTVGDAFVPGDRAAARRRFSVPSGTFAVVSVGRLDVRDGGYKGHELVLRALAARDRADSPMRYLIAGIGDDEARLRRIVDELGLGEAVTFLGKVPAGELPDLYRAADLFALPSRGEGFGIVFLEAMACGTPAIGLAVGGATEALEGLGTACVAEGFDAAFDQAVRAARAMDDRDRADLADRTRAAFGHSAFAASVAAAVEGFHSSGDRRARPDASSHAA